MDSQYKLLSELLSDQAAFITSPKTSLANHWGGGIAPLPPSVYGPEYIVRDKFHIIIVFKIMLNIGFPRQS